MLIISIPFITEHILNPERLLIACEFNTFFRKQNSKLFSSKPFYLLLSLRQLLKIILSAATKPCNRLHSVHCVPIMFDYLACLHLVRLCECVCMLVNVPFVPGEYKNEMEKDFLHPNLYECTLPQRC